MQFLILKKESRRKIQKLIQKLIQKFQSRQKQCYKKEQLFLKLPDDK